jgi:glycosyltransferase involved in cell wall biosynthesis
VKILHVIDSLMLGGTENQFLSLLPELARDHEIVLVTLRDADQPNLGKLSVSRRYCLGFNGSRSLPRTVLRLWRIIRRERPNLVRSQLYWSSIAARLATPRSIPVIFSIHSTMSADGYLKRRSSLWLEKLTYWRRHHLISVSKHALDDFDRHLGLKGPADVMTNFVAPEFVGHERQRRPFGPRFRLVAVGNLKPVKNYAYLVEALDALPRDVSIDIFGEGTERGPLQDRIAATGIAARLMGARGAMWEVLSDYDLFVMPSLYEGCPNAAIEAMAVGLPLLLSDIPVMHEVSHDNALFFDPSDPGSFVDLFRCIQAGEFDLQAMSERGLEIVRTSYLKADYLDRLNAIYERAVATS